MRLEGPPLPQLLFCNQNCPDNSNYRTVLKIIGRGRHVASFLKVVVEVGGGGGQNLDNLNAKKKKNQIKKKKIFVPFFKTPISVGLERKGCSI